MKYTIQDYLKLEILDINLLRHIKIITSIPGIDKTRILILPEQKKIYYINDFNQEVELNVKENIDTGEYQVLLNNDIIYTSGNNTISNEGNSNSKTMTRKAPWGSVGSVDSHEHGAIDISKAAFVKIGFLLLTIILVSIGIASLILLFK